MKTTGVLFVGAFQKKNEVYNASDGRYEPKNTEYTTIAKINKCVRGWMKECFYGDTAKKKLAEAKGKINLNKWTSSELFSLKSLATHLDQTIAFRKKKFNVLENEFFAWSFDEYGVTQDNNSNDDEGQKYVVFIDMHS
jgi:hypothetical protein